MSVDVQWTDDDPETGAKRFVQAERFAGKWTLKVRSRRRENWVRPPRATRDMWEALLVKLERRYQRNEGVTEVDLKFVREAIKAAPPSPSAAPADADSPE
ncbi:MAG: hypothetical protein ACRC7O_08155 [Fimbriiglobus sp.]